jgi:hypothetical protein
LPWILGVVVVVLAVVGLVWFLLSRDHGSTGKATTSREKTTESSDISTTSTPISTPPTPVSPPRETMTVGIVGTCDDGKSCGLRQRAEPRLNAPDLVKDRLKDGMTVTPVCSTTGDRVTNKGRGSSDVWYQIVNGAYVPVVYMNLEGTDDPPPC